jgi:hypothetical protein
MAVHVDPAALMMELVARAEKTPYDDKTQTMWHLIDMLYRIMEAHSNEVADIGMESNAFSTVSMDIHHVKNDMSRIQQWIADHPNANMEDAKKDPDFQQAVKAFNDDMQKYQNDAKNNASKQGWDGKTYGDHGMNEAVENAQMIWDTKVPWHPGQNQSIGDLIKSGDMGGLSDSLFYAAKNTTDKGGTFHDWTAGKGKAEGLDSVDQDFTVFGGNFTQKLNTFGTYLQQEDQVGQNFITSLGSLINMIIQHLGPNG